MREIYEIEIAELVVGTNEYGAGDITVNWDRRSLWLNDNVEFHIILVETTHDNENSDSDSEESDEVETRRDVTNEYILKVRNVQGHSSKDMSQITFNGVIVTYSRRAHVNFVRETVHR